jgi:hypothetical protein
MERDLAYLQAQTRNWDKYCDTRRRMIQEDASRPRANWSGYVVANHLGGHLDIALAAEDCLSVMLDQARYADADRNAATHKYEDAEMRLYRCTLLMEKGSYAEAITALLAQLDSACDTLAVHTMLAQCYTATGDDAGAEKEYSWLLELNPDNLDYHQGLCRAKGLAADPAAMLTGPDGASQLGDKYAQLKALYADLAARFPKCSAVQRVPLSFLVGDDFTAAAAPYVTAAIKKGVPSLFKNLRDLYADADKAARLEALLLGMEAQLREHLRFTAADEPDSAPPSAPVWLWMYLAHHYDYLGDAARALGYVDLAATHTPTLLDIYMLKGTIYKHAGDALSGYYWMNYARTLDNADRYVNNKATRYALQAGNDDQAERTMRIFIKEEDMMGYLYSQEACWFHTQAALCYKEHGAPAQALKRLHQVDDHFESYSESLFDYHLYCPRKGTMRAYSALTKYLDSVRSHKFYVKAGTQLVDLYLALHRQQALEQKAFAARVVAGTGATVEQLASKTVPEAAKAVVERKEAQLKQDCSVILASHRTVVEAEHQERPQYKERAAVLEKKAKKANTPTADDIVAFRGHGPESDYFGWELLAGGGFLKQAHKYAALLLDADAERAAKKNAPQNVGVLFLSLETALAEGKPLLAMQRLAAARKALATLQKQVADGTVTAAQAMRQQVCGLPWFSLRGLPMSVKAQLLTRYLAVQLFVAQAQVSLAVAKHTSANDAAVATLRDKMVAEGLIFADVAKAFQEFKAAQASQASPVSTAAMPLLALTRVHLFAAQTGAEIKGLSLSDELKAFVAQKDKFTCSPADRSVLRNVLVSMNLLNAKTMLAQPSVEGITLTKAEILEAYNVTESDIASIDSVIAVVREVGHAQFSFDIEFMPEEKLVQIKENTKVDVPFVPAKEEKEE